MWGVTRTAKDGNRRGGGGGGGQVGHKQRKGGKGKEMMTLPTT